MHFMSTSDIEEKPQDFPSKTEEEVHFLNKIAGKIVDMVFLSSQPTVKKIVFSNGEDSDECPSEYCVCRTEKPGLTMVFCDNKACPNGIWFHLECLDMEETDVPEGKWWCTDECRNSKPSLKKRRKTVAGSLQDNKRNYAIKVLWHGLNQKIKRDAIRENDGSRIIRHWKFDLLGFYENHHPKYFLVCHQLLSAINGAVSPRLQQTLIWNRTVNPNGGLGKNMEMDLQMEHYNKQYKESVKDAAGQLTQDTIARHSQMVGIGKLIRQVYEKQVSGGRKSGVQSKSDIHRDSDIKEFVVMMKDEKVFSTLPGRNHPSFPDITLNLYPKTQPKPFKARLVRLRKEMSMKRDITLQMQRN
ncbi:hypothetical protein DPMN_035366 [Dreissena polymorpha]|nr:hypothetical protein DPMN_035366 [Dreissena polymorpha]